MGDIGSSLVTSVLHIHAVSKAPKGECCAVLQGLSTPLSYAPEGPVHPVASVPERQEPLCHTTYVGIKYSVAELARLFVGCVCAGCVCGGAVRRSAGVGLGCECGARAGEWVLGMGDALVQSLTTVWAVCKP